MTCDHGAIISTCRTCRSASYGTGRQGDGAANYAEAWFVFVGPDGQLSTDRNAPHIAVGVTAEGRVRVHVPEGLDVSPDVAERIAERIVKAAAVARNPEARFALAEGQAAEVEDDYPERRKQEKGK